MRLKDTALKTIIDDDNVFQFHIGAIKRISGQAYIATTDKFQFHIGAIKSILEDKLISLFTQFQFHIGAIKRQEEIA